ncbi:hypothetical protein D3C77_459130 [compost metagenome]
MYFHESSVNCFGHSVTRFISTALLELNEVAITDRSGIIAATENRTSNTVIDVTNIFSPLDSSILP